MEYINPKDFKAELLGAAIEGITRLVYDKYPDDGITLHKVNDLSWELEVPTKQGPLIFLCKVNMPWKSQRRKRR